MVSVVISIGSNCEDKKAKVEEALIWLKSLLIQPKSSEIYETPCALKIGNCYMNAVISGFYQGDGMQLEEILKEKEKEMGRNEAARKKGEVLIDLDIVILNNEIVKNWDYRQTFFQIGYRDIK